MLIILSGAETIRKTKLASIINVQLNNIKINNVDGTADEFWRAQLAISNSNHYKMQFRNIFYDYGADLDRVFKEGGDYQKLLNSYYNRTHDNMIITGSFSKLLVEKITDDLKTESTFINITRHPSVSYVIDAGQPDPYGPYDTDLNVPMLKRRNISSFLNSVSLKNIDIVNTVKFEDMLTSGKLTISNTDIILSNDYKNYNSVLTNEEYKKPVVNDKELLQFNNTFQHLNSSIKVSAYDVPNKIFEQLPEDVFSVLDYIPLTIEEIYGHTF
jgi:hypothetical protein